MNNHSIWCEGDTSVCA